MTRAMRPKRLSPEEEKRIIELLEERGPMTTSEIADVLHRLDRDKVYASVRRMSGRSIRRVMRNGEKNYRWVAQ